MNFYMWHSKYGFDKSWTNYPPIDLKMTDAWYPKLINLSSVLWTLIIMDEVTEDIIHRHIDRIVQFPFGPVVDVNVNDETGINSIKDILKHYQIICKLNLLYKFNERLEKNIKNAFTVDGEYVFKIIMYEFQKLLYKIDQKIYTFEYHELPRFESKDIMMVDVGDHLIKYYMDPAICTTFSFTETVVIGLILRNQFLSTKQLYANLKTFSTYFSLNYNTELNLKSIKTTIISLRKKNIIRSTMKHNKSAFHHSINISNTDIIILKKTSQLLNNILNIQETKIQKIKNNLINKSPLNIDKMKKKINYINYILNQLTLQNFEIPASDLPNYYNNNIIHYKKKINSLTTHLKNSTFPQNIKNNYKGLLTPTTTPAKQSTSQTILIQDTPERLKQNVKTFYKRSIRTDVLYNLKTFSHNDYHK